MPRPTPWFSAFTWLALSRLVIAAIAVTGAVTFLDQRALQTVGTAALDPAVIWHKWDVVWYERIALHGYGWQPGTDQGQALAGFFPLYPLLVGAILRVVPGLSFFWTGTVVSLAATTVALVLIARSLAEGIDATRRVWLVLLTSAGSFYLSIPYTEGLFLLWVVVTLVLTRQERYLLAGLCAGLAAVTRVHGLALIAVPVIAVLQRAERPWAERLPRAAAASALFAIPFLGYMGFLWRVQGAPDAFVQSQGLWSNSTPYPLKALVGLVVYRSWLSNWLHGAYWFLYVAVLVRAWRRLPLGEAMFCAGALLISTQQESFHGIYRYITPLVPLAFAVARERDDVRHGVIGLNLIFATIMILAFVTWNRLAV